MKKMIATLAIVAIAAVSANAAVVSSTIHGTGDRLAGSVVAGDVLSGLIGTELPGDNGWHGAASLGLPAFTNDIADGGLAGLMNDFPVPGTPAKLVQYDLAAATDIASIGILSGNDGKDGRVFSTTVIQISTDNGATFTDLGYFQSDASWTENHGTWDSTYVSISDDAGALATGVTNIIFNLYGVDNTMGQMRDPFDGMNPYTGTDDGLNAPNTSPLIWELDVVATPEPAGLALLAIGGLLIRRRRNA